LAARRPDREGSIRRPANAITNRFPANPEACLAAKPHSNFSHTGVRVRGVCIARNHDVPRLSAFRPIGSMPRITEGTRKKEMPHDFFFIFFIFFYAV
jgi:hypothetical protein